VASAIAIAIAAIARLYLEIPDGLKASGPDLRRSSMDLMDLMMKE